MTLPLAEHMRALQQGDRKAFIPFLTAGFPDGERFAHLLRATAPHADVIEVGLPFSDPVADGPTICAASEVALAAGATTDSMFATLEATADLPPVIVMTYLNPVLAYGPQRFFERAAQVGVQGVLLTDLPPEDGEEIVAQAAAQGIAAVLLVSPTTSAARLTSIAQRANGFLYCVAVRGITGVRRDTSSDAQETVARVRAACDLPVVVGFGIATPEHVQQTCAFADGAVVGSALVDWIAHHVDDADLVAGYEQQVRALAQAAHG